MALTNILVRIIIISLIFVISSLPLYFAIKALGGKTSFLKAILITIVSGIIVSAIEFRFQVWGGLIAFLILVVIYREAFRLKWWKAFFVWFLQLVFIVLFYLLLIFLGILTLEISLLL